MGHETLILSAMNNMGKIYMNAELKPIEVDPSNFRNKIHHDHADIHTVVTKEIKDDLKVMSTIKDKANQNKTEKFKSVVEGNNEFLRNLKNNMKNVNDEDLFEDIVDEGKFWRKLIDYIC